MIPLDEARSDMWRYAALLPVRHPAHILSMGEGWTPLLRARRLGDAVDLPNLWIKDESANPAGTWESRGYSCAVSCARQDGRAVIGSAPNEQAAAACALYAAAAGLTPRIDIHPDWPEPFAVACRAAGAIPGPPDLEDANRLAGLATVAYEIAEQLDWRIPALILCPSLDGARALRLGFERLDLGMPEIDCAPSIPLRDAIDSGLEVARLEGVLPAPEMAGCLFDLRNRTRNSADTVVILNTASGMNYAHLYGRRYVGMSATEADKLGGLITPR